MKKLRTAVIGAGNMGRNHLRIYSQISNLIAVSDLDEELGNAAAKNYNSKYYKDYKKLIKDEKPDAVSVVVPTKYHKEVTIYCLKNRVPTLVEKPIAQNIKEARAMMKSSNQNKTTLMVGHVERFNPAITKLKKFIASNKFGRITNLLSIRVGVNPPKTPNSDVVLDLAVHDVDIFNFLINKFPLEHKILKDKIYKNNLFDSGSLILRYEGATGLIHTNWITPVKMRKLYVTGTHGFAEVDYITQELIIHNKIAKFKKDGNYFHFISLADNSKREVFVSRKEPLKEELIYFLKNLRYKSTENYLHYAVKALETVL